MNIKILFLAVTILGFNSLSFGQKFKLNNAIVVGQQDKQEDRFTLEVKVLELLASKNVKAKASLNLVKQGGSPLILANDSIQSTLSDQGYDTYMLISVRGYDKRFKPSETLLNLRDELDAGHMFPLYRDGITSVTFSVTFYRNNKPVHYELIRTGNVGSREAVMKKFLKRLNKRLEKDWL